jgi:hypothetical protein
MKEKRSIKKAGIYYVFVAKFCAYHDCTSTDYHCESEPIFFAHVEIEHNYPSTYDKFHWMLSNFQTIPM